MQNPAIHITQSVFIENKEKIKTLCSNPEKLFRFLASLPSVSHRSVVKTNIKVKKKLDKITGNSTENVNKFYLQLKTYLETTHHKLRLIRPQDSEYSNLKQVTAIADEFCEFFNLEHTKGYNAFIYKAVELMGKRFQLSKINYFSQKIFDSQQDKIVMKADLKIAENKKNTVQLYNIWQEIVLKYTGQTIEIQSEDDFIHFIYARQEADYCGATYYDWIDSQFDKLTSIGFTPSYGALYGLKSVTRYKSYMQDKGLKPKMKAEGEFSEYLEIRQRRGE